MGKVPRGAMSSPFSEGMSFDVINTETSGVKMLPFETKEAIEIIEKLKTVGEYKFADQKHILLEVNGTLLRIIKVQP